MSRERDRSEEGTGSMFGAFYFERVDDDESPTSSKHSFKRDCFSGQTSIITPLRYPPS